VYPWIKVKKPFSPIVRASAVSAARPVAHQVEETIFSDNPLSIRHPLTSYIWCIGLTHAVPFDGRGCRTPQTAIADQ
jgi:hypothetical protein